MEGSAQPLPLVPGAILAGKYRVEHILGQGAMGVVVAARHVDLGELFAIKLLLPKALAIPQAVDRFLREARASARLKGDHVVKVTDVGRTEDGSPYMVMEHLSGIDLQKHVRRSGPLPVAEAVGYMLQICDAIAEAHSLGIVHRDLKPSNIFLARRPNGTTCVKVLDFGISKQTAPDAVDLTGTGDVFGTPLYMAPEQMARAKAAEARSDIWSLGIVLYELVTGTTPFHATSITEIVTRVLQEEPVAPSQLRPGLPPGLDAIVARCLQKRPEHRFQQVSELVVALQSMGSPDAIPPARGPSLPELPGAAPAITSAAAIPPTLGAGSAIHSSTPRGYPPAPLAGTASSWSSTGHVRQAKGNGLVVALLVGGLVAALLTVGGIWLAFRSPAGGVPPPSSAPEPAIPETAVEPAASIPTSFPLPVVPTGTPTATTQAASTSTALGATSTSARPPASTAKPAAPGSSTEPRTSKPVPKLQGIF